ncbi:PRC-barrel domain-containing protein [Rhizobium sp. CECT 9324]|uniref:PRC-barrel domain-containing protein n=1 Tax=Rhizobium sp. CECT 9324 TaxID=2845820 RepID=UPI001E346D40|nr:PRC-barrel domain-containing protein [Rhizobium sp. CECT 9324]CAH0342592.1 hypothetical protein RHI9324_04321 [Rhizobium sp. CECT 9324]
MQYNSASQKHRKVHLALAIGMVLSIAIFLPPPMSAVAQNVVIVDVDVKEVAKGYRASELVGADVENSSGEAIGSIDDLIVDREKVLFSILEVGGFLGIGGFLVAVPYNSLQINADGSQIVLAQGSKEELQKLPEFKYEGK